MYNMNWKRNLFIFHLINTSFFFKESRNTSNYLNFIQFNSPHQFYSYMIYYEAYH